MMRRPFRNLLLATLVALTPLAAQAQPHRLDPRIQTIEYDPDRIVSLRGTLGYQFMIEFAPDEHIETVSIGDSIGWQVTPNRKANVLFLKPIDAAAGTNMTVLSDQRRYAFQLSVAPRNAKASVLYIARMSYPQPVMAEVTPEPVAAPAPPKVANAAYLIGGSADIRPSRVFDDGQQTYFQWANESAIPAIFAVSPSGSETLVNSAIRDGYTVVDALAPKFVLRNGAQIATVINETAAPVRSKP